jgi:hypothetical protein
VMDLQAAAHHVSSLGVMETGPQFLCHKGKVLLDMQGMPHGVAIATSWCQGGAAADNGHAMGWFGAARSTYITICRHRYVYNTLTLHGC